MSTEKTDKSDKEVGTSVAAVSVEGKEAKKGTEIFGKDERKMARARELVAANAKAIEDEKEVKVGKEKVEVPVLQAAQAAEIAAKEEEARERAIEDAHRRLIEKEIKAAA